MKGPWKPDLHLHSIASDGMLSATEVMVLAKDHGLNLVALTDHDTLAGLQEAEQAAKTLGLGFIPGIELSLAGEEEVHLLAYFVHDQMPALRNMVLVLREDRANRSLHYLDKLHALGINLRREDIPVPMDKSFHRAHFAQALVNIKAVASIQEAFDRYLGVGRPAYVHRLNLGILDTICTLTGLGAATVLAHPRLIRNPDLVSQSSICAMKEAGLTGIEVYHPSHQEADRLHWLHMSRSLGLLVTGGSDFHRYEDAFHGQPGSQLDHWSSAEEDAAMFLSKRPEQAGFEVSP